MAATANLRTLCNLKLSYYSLPTDNLHSYTMSATSSVFNFRYEHGRRYHAYAEGQYPVPNDEVRRTTARGLTRTTLTKDPI
jgi:hypothetical protein